ncbi:E3 ubiquitin-protein ligase RNF14-like [Triticum dicoccoides]|uniref:E3 ubiquitin-protein ligase RNF14-like n=1 Tax=Triticum dicoccoides TaxID=85692 RepID=UPI00188F1A2E|nr:E3 ubiquitin-protein ligase RNF14-like [Triticum dicoccoides]
MAAASVGATTSRLLQPSHDHSPEFSPGGSSSSSSRAAEARPVPSCDGGAEDNVPDLDSPWAAAAEAESRLDEAAIAAAAAGLTLSAEDEAEAEEIRDNLQRQDDELMALEAIYGDDLVEFESRGGLRYFQIYIRYDLPDGAELCAKLSSLGENSKHGGCPDGGSEDHENKPDEFSYTSNFEYLPPLVLTCLLPKSYPSKDPPCFTLTAKWMDEHNVSQLCEMLDSIWAELQGQEVVYQWVEWIHNSSLSHLWFDGKIMLGQDDTPAPKVDMRAISRRVSLESVIPSMLSYCSKKHYQAFLEDLHMCMICLNQSTGSNFIKLPCQHLFCAKCMETLCRMHVKEGSVFQLVCPHAKCNASIPQHVLKQLLSEEEFERWDRLALEKALDSMADVVFCPKCVIGCVEDEDNTAQCPKCSFIFCSFCKELWHPGKQCLTPEQKIQHRKASGRMSEREMAQELLNIKELYKDVRLCPHCRMAISKTAGCNKMTCVSCGKYFCFRCGKPVSGYDHFKDCKLFEARDIAEWEREMDQIQIGNQIRAQQKPLGGILRCPKCGEKNFKDDEKYLFCWACRASYCQLCKRVVDNKRMKSEHWGSIECLGLDKF